MTTAASDKLIGYLNKPLPADKSLKQVLEEIWQTGGVADTDHCMRWRKVGNRIIPEQGKLLR